MNIACFSHYFSPEIGAPSARIQELAREWLKQGHGVQVVTCFPNHPAGTIYPGYDARLYLREEMDGIVVHRHWSYITPNKGIVRRSLGHASFFPAALLISNRRMTRPDVAIGTSPTFFAAMAASRLARKHGIPFVMEVRDLWPAVFVELGIVRSRRLIRLLERWEMSLYRRASTIVTVTEAFRRDLIRRGIPAGKVHTVYNGADVQYWKPMEAPDDLREQLGLSGHFVVLYLGAHGLSQALCRILESARLLEADRDVQFLFVGDGAEKQSLVRQADTSRLRNVRFIDPVGKDEARRFYALANVSLVPLKDIPLFDSFIPSKMYEIMAMERPTIGSVRGEAAEILKRSEGAVVVAPEDSQAIAGAIRSLKQNPERARRMGRQARRFVVEHFSRRTLALDYSRILADSVSAFRARMK
jgi:glycosyltransferase involved in cell wall biosynthesis